MRIVDRDGPLALDDRRIRCVSFFPGRYYSRLFFLDIPPRNTGDVMGALWRRDDNAANWFLRYRFRYYKSASAWDGKDEKSWYAVNMPNVTEDEAVLLLRRTFVPITLASGRPMEELIITGDCTKAMALCSNPLTMPRWMHMKRVNQKDVPAGTNINDYLADLDRREKN